MKIFVKWMGTTDGDDGRKEMASSSATTAATQRDMETTTRRKKKKKRGRITMIPFSMESLTRDVVVVVVDVVATIPTSMERHSLVSLSTAILSKASSSSSSSSRRR